MASSNKYAVFISFRGEDTRDNFTSHLYDALTRNKIHTFIDDRLERGDEISPALLKAIQGSDLSVIIFSENYASSTWCLKELVHILECNKEYGQILIPVFYRVDPSHVRNQKGSYADAFAKHEERFGSENGMEKVHQWRAALTEAANLSGWDSRVTKPESELIKKIVQDILKKLNYRLAISEVKGLVGIEKRIKKVESLLCIDSLPGVRVIGIWGMGGIGKTTLAAAVFGHLYSQFESCYFLSNVRKESEKRGLNHLREKLVSELLEEEKTNRGFPLVEYGFIEYRLRRTKVLIVVDDVNNSIQIDFLVGDRDQFGYGSRIILTARNLQLLRKVADDIYGVEGLNDSEASHLLCSNAFKRNTVGTEHLVLSQRVVNYANGNPLAIKVLGSSLYSKSEEEWESTLNKLEKVPNKDIQGVLRISYDELDDREQDIFLDIACFFEGRNFGFVKSILDGCGFFASTGIQSLIEKSLVTIDKYNNLKMHHLLQEMGREIVREESIKQPGNRSRLWRVEDIRQVLKRNTGSAKVEGIFLDTCGMKDITLSPEVFSKMHNLRLLEIFGDEIFGEKCQLKFPQGLQCLPDALAYLCWDGYPLKSLPSDFSPESIVVLEMPNSQLVQLWDGVQELGNLKRIDLSWSPQLTQIPNLSLAPNLEEVNLKGCISLKDVPSYFQDRLTSLNLSYCRNLKKLPEMPQSMESLDLREIEVQELPSSIWSLHKLHSFYLSGCKYIKHIPSSASMLNSLNTLTLFNCTSLTEFHELPRNIGSLNLSNTAIEVIPSSIQCLSGLYDLHLGGCKRLKSLPTSICKLKSLKSISLSGCLQLESFPKILEPMESLKRLYLNGTAIKRLHSSIKHLFSLVELRLSYCKNFEFFPISHLSKLGFLSSDGSSLTILNLSGTNIEKVPKSIEHLCLIVLVLSNCKRLKSLPKLPNALEVLHADHCTSLVTVSSSRTEIRFWNGYRSHVFINGEVGHTFFNCLNLDETAKRNIMADAELIIWFEAALAKEKFYNSPKKRREKKYDKYGRDASDTPPVCVCYPGSEIPKWFMYQARGPSVNIKLPLHWFNDNFLGFALCVVANFDGDDDNMENDNTLGSVHLKCETRFKTSNGGESHRFYCFPNVWGDSDTRKVNSDHVFLWYYSNLYDKIKSSWSTTSLHNHDDITEVEFYFYPDISRCTVKQCGIRLLNEQDAEIAISSNRDKQDNEEEEEEEEEDDDDDEPHPKRKHY